MIVTVFSQICSALTYVHDQGLVHGLVTSHAIQLVTANFAKLGNFEYTIDKSVALFHCLLFHQSTKTVSWRLYFISINSKNTRGL